MDAKYVGPNPPTQPDEIARFDYTRTNNKTAHRISLAAELIYNMAPVIDVTHPPAPFDTLTKKQKIDIVAGYLEGMITELAKQQIIRNEQAKALINAQVEFETDTEL